MLCICGAAGQSKNRISGLRWRVEYKIEAEPLVPSFCFWVLQAQEVAQLAVNAKEDFEKVKLRLSEATNDKGAAEIVQEKLLAQVQTPFPGRDPGPVSLANLAL